MSHLQLRHFGGGYYSEGAKNSDFQCRRRRFFEIWKTKEPDFFLFFREFWGFFGLVKIQKQNLSI
uniref:Uncharacterized protein n=1 Tax=Meloidogyne enterolobii TaxID=390850 RepID=A0A6V7XVM6_MELEN|nr:unnamed protein product [Meloidogyne enterolobii]